MATDALTQAILQGLDPGTYRPLSQIRQGEALQAVGQDASPTSKWGAIGRLANAAAGTYINNSATSDLAKTIAGGKKSAQDQLLAAIEASQGTKAAAVPSAPPANAPLQPPVQSAVPPSASASPFPTSTQPTLPAVAPNAPDADSPNAAVANRFPGGPAFMQSAAYQPPEMPAPQAPPAGGSTAVAAIDKATQPRGIRNNNALNIEDGPFAKSQPGYTGSDGRFAKFQTADHGNAAASALLDSYDQKHGINTVAGIVNRWAPPSDGNNTMAYAADVAKRIGIDPNAPVPPEKRQELIAAMGQHENGVPIPMGASQAPYQVAGPAVAAPSAASGGAAVAAAAPSAGKSDGLDTHKLLAVLQNPYTDDATKQLVGKLLAAQLTPENAEFKEITAPDGTKRQVFVNARDQTVTPAGKQAPTSPYAGLQGPELMTAVQQANPALASQAQAVLEGRVPYPSGSRLNPQQQQLKELVTQIDPNFTAANSKVMQDTLQDYGTKGRTGQARVAANTMLGHADVLDKAIDKLGNYTYGSDLGANRVHDFVAGNTDPAYQKARADFETTKKALSIEAEKALAGHTTVSGIHEQMANFDRAKSPEELHSAVKSLVHVLGSRLDSMAAGFDTSMKTRTQGHEFLDPKGREIFNRFEGVNAPASSDVGRIPALENGEAAPGATETKAASAAPSAAKQISSKAEYDALAPGTPYVAPDGSMRTKK